jgi:hypothetical protein
MTVRDRDVREAVAWVDRSGIAPDIEALLRPTRRGRPRQLTVRALLVGLKLAVESSKTACLNEVHTVLTEGIAQHHRHELGTEDRRTGAVVTLPQVRRLFSSVTTRLDPSAHTQNDLSVEERDIRAAALQDLLDRMLDATMPAGLQHGGAYAVDGTGTWSWARGKKRGESTADPDAAWGRKTSKAGKDEAYFGYELHAIVRTSNLNQPGEKTPCLAERIVVAAASTNCVTVVLPALQGLRADGHRIREVIADRGYTYKVNWTQELYALGIDPVLDLHATQYGPRGSHAGARIVTGVPHCPAMPPSFDTIKRPERLAESPALEVFITDITRREQWAFRRAAGPDITGKERYECPAQAGKLRCPLQPKSMTLPLALPKVMSPPEDPPACCEQRTITVPGDIDAKSRQRHYWGSREWISSFSRRSRVEGWFGNLKNDSTEALNRGSFRVMGLCKTSIMLGIYAATTNLRLLRRWAKRCHSNDDLLPLLQNTAATADDATAGSTDTAIAAVRGHPPG